MDVCDGSGVEVGGVGHVLEGMIDRRAVGLFAQLEGDGERCAAGLHGEVVGCLEVELVLLREPDGVAVPYESAEYLRVGALVDVGDDGCLDVGQREAAGLLLWQVYFAPLIEVAVQLFQPVADGDTGAVVAHGGKRGLLSVYFVHVSWVLMFYYAVVLTAGVYSAENG